MNRENRLVNWLAMNLADELVMSPESRAGYLSGERAARAALIGQMLKNHWDVDAIHNATAIPVDEIRAVQRESNLTN